MEIAAKFLFVAVVSCYLLARVFSAGAAPVEIAVYGATAAVGLEYLVASWRSLWQHA